MLETLTIEGLMHGLRRINKGSGGGNLYRSERIVAGFIGAGLELLPIPDGDILPFLPQLIECGLGQLNRVHVDPLLSMQQAFEQETGHSFANFEHLSGTEEAYDQSLLMVERVIVAVTGNKFVADEVKAALRSVRYLAEREIMAFCYSSVGIELMSLAKESQRAGQFGTVCVQSGLDDCGDVILRFTLGPECAFELEWNGIGCTLEHVFGGISPDAIGDALSQVLEYWRPEGFIAV